MAYVHMEEVTLESPTVVPSKGQAGAITVRSNGVPGWPRVIEVEGAFKCLVCDGIAENSAVCLECRTAIKLLRSTDNITTMQKLLEMEHLDVLLHVMEGLTKDAVAAYLARGLKDIND